MPPKYVDFLSEKFYLFQKMPRPQWVNQESWAAKRKWFLVMVSQLKLIYLLFNDFDHGFSVASWLSSCISSSLFWFYISCSFDKSEFGKYLYGYILTDHGNWVLCLITISHFMQTEILVIVFLPLPEPWSGSLFFISLNFLLIKRSLFRVSYTYRVS